MEKGTEQQKTQLHLPLLPDSSCDVNSYSFVFLTFLIFFFKFNCLITLCIQTVHFPCLDNPRHPTLQVLHVKPCCVLLNCF